MGGAFGRPRHPAMMTSPIKDLSQIISDSVASLEKVCKKNNTPFPSLDDPFSPTSEAFRSDPEAAEAANKIAAAALQLAATVLPPPAALFTVVSGHFKSAALRVCLEANVTEILREAGPDGLHVDEIAAKSKISGMKLARLMRYLATHHVYKEIKPDVFTNTRISSMLDTGKSVEELFASPDSKHDNTHGFPALAGHHLDEVTKSAAYLWETMTDPASANSGEVTKTAFNRAFDEELPIWAWFEKPDQNLRLRRFGSAMQGVAALQPADAILSAFDWKSLPKDSIVVDVGGGVGTSSLVLAETFPDLKIVVQDRPSVVEEGIKLWNTKLPKVLESGQVKLQAHDFFTAQPITNASVFLLKQIMHDWSDFYASKILVELRKVATSDTKLVLVDSLMPFACRYPKSDAKNAVPGAVPQEAPEPLLANYGAANEMGYNGDLTMLLLFNSLERTVKHLSGLLESTGWRLTKVRRDGANNFLQPVEAVPI
jgi:hypothetical protein